MEQVQLKNGRRVTVYPRNAEQAISPDRPVDLRPDVQVHQLFFPETSNDVNRLYNFRGNRLAVLNPILPVAFNDSYPVFYASFESNTGLQISSTGLVTHKIIPLCGGSTLQGEYQDIRLTTTTVYTATGGSWAFALAKFHSTPIIVALSRDAEIGVPYVFYEPSFRIGLLSTIPASASTTNLVFYHGLHPFLKSVSVVCNNAVNNLEVRGFSEDPLNGTSNAFEEFSETPLAFPYNKTFPISNRYSGKTRVDVTGGGSGESGNVLIVFTLSLY